MWQASTRLGQLASPWSCPWPSFCSLRSGSQPCRLFLNILGAPSRARVSAPNQLFPLPEWCLTFPARCLTPCSSRAPPACPAGPAGGTRYIFASRARAPHRRCRLYSNVRPHTSAAVAHQPFNISHMHIRFQQRALLSLTLCTLLLAGCVTTRVVHVYDQKCQVMTRKMELTFEKAQALDACSNHECVAQVIGGAFSLAASTVVSGSVALVGNVAFWMEKAANCRAAQGTSAVSTSVAPVRPASAAGS